MYWNWYNGYSYPHTWRKAYNVNQYGQAGYSRPIYSDQNGRGWYPRIDRQAWSNWNTHSWGSTLDYGNYPYNRTRQTRRFVGSTDSSNIRSRQDYCLRKY